MGWWLSCFTRWVEGGRRGGEAEAGRREVVGAGCGYVLVCMAEMPFSVELGVELLRNTSLMYAVCAPVVVASSLPFHQAGRPFNVELKHELLGWLFDARCLLSRLI